jgi:hypothetical protein
MNDNKLIAEFMGLRKVPCNIGTEDGHFTEGYEHPRVNVPIILSGMKYKYSWDWLMPVVDEIIKSRDKQNADWDLTDFKYGLQSTNIDMLYKAVIEFIKTYNKTKL